MEPQTLMKEARMNVLAAEAWMHKIQAKGLQEFIEESPDVQVRREAVAHLEESLAIARRDLQAARERHPGQVNLASHVEKLNDLEAVMRRDWFELTNGSSTWVLDSGDKVQCRVTKGLRVEDSQAAARALLDRQLWAFVKDLKVDAGKLRPLVDAGGVPGLEPEDRRSLAYIAAKEAS